MKSLHAVFSSFSRLTIALWASVTLGQSGDTSPAVVTYDQVQPVFKKHCVSCHGVERERGDLDLSSTTGIKAGSSSGPVVIPGKPEESLLYSLSAHLESPRMPPGKAKIPQREIDLIRNWIEGGLREKPGKSIAAATTKTAPKPVSATPTAQPSAASTAVRTLPRPTAITALAMSPKDASVAVSGLREILVFPREGSKDPTGIAFPEGDLYALRYSRDGEWLLAGGGIGAESGKVVVFEASTGRRLFDVGQETDVVLTFDLSPDRSLIALGGPGRTVKVYRTADQQLVHTLRKHTDWILSMAFSPDGLLLASGDRFGGLQVWEAVTGKPFYSLRGHTGAVNAIAWGSTSDQLLSAGQDGIMRLWDMHQGSPLKSWNAEVGGIVCAEWTQASEFVAGGREKQVAVFDADGKRLRNWTMPDEVVELAVSFDGARVITGDAAGNLAAHLIASGESAGSYIIPVSNPNSRTQSKNAVATVQPSFLTRKPRSRPTELAATESGSTNSPSTESSPVRSSGEMRLQEAREALLSTEAAVRATEESLAKLKASAAALRRIIGSQEETVPKASETPQSK